jgi:ribonuclease Y
MEIVISAVLAAAIAGAVAWVLWGRSTSRPGSALPAQDVLHETQRRAEELRAGAEEIKLAQEEGREDLTRLRDQVEQELRERRAEMVRLEERILQREESLEAKLSDVGRREQSLTDRERELTRLAEQLRDARKEHLRELERIGRLTQAQAKQILLHEIEADARHESAKIVRQIEEETRRDADRRVRSILSVVMQRLAAGHAAETTVSLLSLPSDDMKGRIIGREGRNIRVLESLTGVDFIIDDTPSAVVLSAFDGVRREIAKLTLEKLLQDGRIHPARIEEAYYQAKSEIDNHIVEQGEQALFEANVHSVHPELIKLLGRLKYRTSYGQNVLSHSIEVSRLASMMADELGASSKTARRAALLHDIGKAVSHEVEGPHALVGGELARRYKEAEAVAHAMEAHHNEVEMQTIEAVIVQAADALSGARPGARGESLEQYIKRLKDLEEIANNYDGVEKVYAMQAGREIRVMVAPGEVGDDEAALLSREIARDIERRIEYPGQIKVTVIRESRAIEYAK